MNTYVVAVWHAGQRVEYPARSYVDALSRAQLEIGRLRTMGFDVERVICDRRRWNAQHPVGGGRVHVRIDTR